VPTFETTEAVCFAEKREIWRSHGPVNDWRHSADRYVLAKLGAMSVDKVGNAAVYEVLRPIAPAGTRVDSLPEAPPPSPSQPASRVLRWRCGPGG